jgi:glycine betaine/proline transport system substrate-binding protein
MKQLKIIILILLMAPTLWQCKSGGSAMDDEQRKIQIVYTDWAENIALTHLTYYLLTERLSYEVILKQTSVSEAYQEVASGNSDVFMDAWLPQTHQSYFIQYKDSLENLGPVYPFAETGLAVPDYIDINSIADLAKTYKGPITGIDSGAGIMEGARRAISSYQLPNDLLILSGPEMSHRFEEAYKRRDTIVITGWKPHWLFHRYQIKFLEDPESSFPGKEQIAILGRNGFTKEHPHAALFFERMSFTEKEMNELIYEVQKDDDNLRAVRKWSEKHAYLVNQWLRDLAPERLKIM